jgi:hypothetical protein
MKFHIVFASQFRIEELPESNPGPRHFSPAILHRNMDAGDPQRLVSPHQAALEKHRRENPFVKFDFASLFEDLDGGDGHISYQSHEVRILSVFREIPL